MPYSGIFSEKCDLSQNKKVIRFMQKKTKSKTPKSKVEIPIHEALEEYLLSGPTSGAPNAPVFPELYGKPGSGKSDLSMAFKRIVAKAAIDAGVIRERSGAAGRSLWALSFHSLRHSFNSAFANAGVSQELPKAHRARFCRHEYYLHPSRA